MATFIVLVFRIRLVHNHHNTQIRSDPIGDGATGASSNAQTRPPAARPAVSAGHTTVKRTVQPTPHRSVPPWLGIRSSAHAAG